MSSFFLVPKPDGSYRFILNLKNFKSFVKKEHFKIEDIRTAINLLNKDDYMCRLDLKEAYFFIPIHRDYKKYLRFKHRDQLYEFNILPFGLSSAPFVFTKIGKTIVNWLRNNGVRVVIYLDDFLILGRSKEECEKDTKLAISIPTYVGFIINWNKSETIPKHVCKFLGFNINSINMTLELPQEKRVKIKEMLDVLLNMERINVKVLAKCISVLVAACPAVAYGWLYYKHLESIKRNALKTDSRNMNKWTTLSLEAKEELHWWQSQILTIKNKIRSSNFDMEIFSDASKTGWGAIYGNKEANCLWNREEREMHINFLEVKAAFLALKCFATSSFNKQILLRIDNITAPAYINKMGGIRHKDLLP